MLLGSLADDEYWSEYGVMVVIDGPGTAYDSADYAGEDDLDPGLGLDGDLLEVFGMQLPPGGTVAHAGTGWLWGRVGWMDSYHVVRLEAHDAPPADDRGDWEEVLETPYWSCTGTVVLSTLTSGWDAEAGALELGSPGLYRVRVSCARDFSASREDDYRPLRKTPPGFARPASRAARAGERGQGDGADDSGGDGTFEEGDIWRLQFWPSPGDAEPPRWLARLEPVAAVADDDEDGAGGPDGGAGELGERLYDIYGELAADLAAVALWTPGGAVGTVADLAARVLASPGQVRAGLLAAVSAGHLRVEGDLADDGAPLSLTPLPPPPPDHGPPQRLPAEDLGASTAFADVEGTLERLLSAGMAASVQTSSDDEHVRDGGASHLAFAAIAGPLRSRPRLPDGPPPAAGIITSSSELVVWRAEVPEVLANVEQYTWRAVATPYGIVVIGSKRAVLVRPGGEQIELAPDPEPYVALSADGRHLAIASVKFGRRDKFRLYLADLADGSAEILDCPENFSIDSLRGGVVTYGMYVGDEPGCFSWAPGRAPWPVPYRQREVDRLTGTSLSRTEPGDYLIIRPDGAELTVPRRYDAQDSRLAPGGRWLYDFGFDPPTMTVTDVSGPAPGPAVTWPLPRGSATELVSGRRPTWEDATHVLLTIPYGDIPAIRVDVTTGATERLRLDRHGQGERGQYGEGTEFSVAGFVEPFQLPGVTRHRS
ncbi:MAG TPA: hypothetical protein VGR98_16095 [Streptosporangiaceae bacterium]|nr:hypothetical protein [Streptosporangiaceae bacterium]